jgi:hypothetical protein
MKAGDILLFKGERGFSKVIAWGTDSEYSHVAVCVAPEMNLGIEAMAWKGVRGIDTTKINQEYDTYRIKQGNEYDTAKTLSHLVSKLNSRYDYPGVIFLGIIKLLSKIGKPLKKAANRWQKERDYFCSELCYEAFFKGGGLDIVPQIGDVEITSPGDIAKSPVIERLA